MSKIIQVAEIAQKNPGTGRHIGEALGKIVCPGDIVDFEDFIEISNSFADQFIITFLQKYSSDELKRIQFKHISPLLRTLLNRAVQRRVFYVKAKPIFKDSFQGQSLPPFCSVTC